MAGSLCRAKSTSCNCKILMEMNMPTETARGIYIMGLHRLAVMNSLSMPFEKIAVHTNI